MENVVETQPGTAEEEKVEDVAGLSDFIDLLHEEHEPDKESLKIFHLPGPLQVTAFLIILLAVLLEPLNILRLTFSTEILLPTPARDNHSTRLFECWRYGYDSTVTTT